MLVKSAKRYINTLDKILKNQHNDIITEITEDDDMDIFSVTLKFHIGGLYCFVAAFDDDDNVLYYVEGNGRAVTYIISDNETQKESMYTILNRIYDIVDRLSTEEPEEPEEPEETEETTEENSKDVMEVKQELNINHCPNQDTCCIVSPLVHCNYNYKSDSCIKAHKNFIHECESVHKQMKAISNQEWHHVSLRTLANIDNDMLDEKRRNYIFLYHLIKDFRKYAFEIKREDVYFDLVSNVLRNIQKLYFNNVISHKAYRYATRHVQVVSVEKGYFMSEREETFGFKKSRRYNVTLR